MTTAVQTALKGTPELTGGALLELRDVGIQYDSGTTGSIVRHVDFQLYEGETVLFLGPSGCGKSTVAMLCANLIPTIVEAEVTGEVMRHPMLLAPGAVGYVFQDPDAQFCMLQADDEIAFGLENRVVPREDMPSRVEEALRDVGLDYVGTAKHETFSGGMKQKLAIACALAMNSKLLILDEPTANLDPLATGQVFQLVQALQADRQTMVIIEHKFDALLPFVDRVVLMSRNGEIHRIGPTKEVVSQEWDWMVVEGVVAPWKANPFSPDISTVPEGNPALNEGEATGNCLAVEVSQGTVKFGEKVVWEHVSVDIAAGSFVAIVGPNGAGKSTLLQVMAGLQRLSGGSVKMFGRPMKHWKSADRMRAVSYCFQNPEYQFIYERVGDELANDIVGNDMPEKTKALLQEFGLEHCAGQSPFGLSQGQKRRLSVASMLREDHEVYFLDEPTYGQDAKTQQTILERLAALHNSGKTIVLTTHDMDLVRRYASHVLVLSHGTIQFQGHPDELFRRTDVLAQAHLLDDVQVGGNEGDIPYGENGDPIAAHHDELHGFSFTWKTRTRKWKTPAEWLNPPIHLLTMLAAIVVAVFAKSLSEALAICALPVLLMMGVGWLSPWQVFKRISPFFGFYVLYIWSLTAYAHVDANTPTFHLLWIHASWPGFIDGLILAFRMLGAVCFGVLFVSTTDITDLVVGLCKNFRMSPKISYGMLAGIRFVPLFQSEWGKLKQARQLRGKDAKWSLMRPVVYALPLMTQAIRMSERVAVAMEARGFVGEVANRTSARSFYRDVRIHWWDFAYGALIVLASIGLLVVF